MTDIKITLTIPENKIEDFRSGFLATCPIPMTIDPNNSEDPMSMIPEFTEKQWIKEWLKRKVIRAYKHGKKQLAEKTAIIDEDLIV